MTVTAADTRWMRQAIAYGARGLGQVWPNPAVGCILVKNGRVLARGRTQPGGRPHAEVDALTRAGDAAGGAVAYVSLEPCAHHGQTGPCCDALIAAGVARVVVACEDPDPRTAGQGIARLRQAGLEVVEQVEEARATYVHQGFFKAKTEGLPLVTLKLAASFDGRIATASGESRWITGPLARRRVHMMRAVHDGVLVGGGTLRADDPDLRVRDLGISRQPVRIGVTSRLELPREARLVTGVAAGPVWMVHGPDAAPDRVADCMAAGLSLIDVAAGAGGVDPEAALRALAARGLTRIFCEGGGSLAASLLRAGLVDRLVGFTAGKVLGGDGTPAVAAFGLSALQDAPRFTLADVTQVGDDILHQWVRA